MNELPRPQQPCFFSISRPRFSRRHPAQPAGEHTGPPLLCTEYATSTRTLYLVSLGPPARCPVSPDATAAWSRFSLGPFVAVCRLSCWLARWGPKWERAQRILRVPVFEADFKVELEFARCETKTGKKARAGRAIGKSPHHQAKPAGLRWLPTRKGVSNAAVLRVLAPAPLLVSSRLTGCSRAAYRVPFLSRPGRPAGAVERRVRVTHAGLAARLLFPRLV